MRLTDFMTDKDIQPNLYLPQLLKDLMQSSLSTPLSSLKTVDSFFMMFLRY